MSNQHTNPVNEQADYRKLDMADTEPPTFTLDARDRHALGALRDYRTRVAGDGVASASYVRMVEDAIDLFVGWQSVNSSLVMSPDQPYRSAHDIDPAQRGVVENRADPLVAEDGEPSAMDAVVGTHPGGEQGTVAPPEPGQDHTHEHTYEHAHDDGSYTVATSPDATDDTVPSTDPSTHQDQAHPQE